MAVRLVTPILKVSDVRESVAWFEQLGWEQGFLWTEDDGQCRLRGVGTDMPQIFPCRDDQGSRGTRPSAYPFDESTGGVWMSWFLDSLEEVDAMHALAVQLGFEVTMPPTAEPWGVREFHLRHPDGHTFRVGCHLG